MEDIFKIVLLYDFYGELLTDKQKTIFEMHYHSDLSFSEIGEELNISRQAARDLLKRTEKILFGYEDKLKLVKKFLEQQKEIKKIKNIVDKIETNPSLDSKVKKDLENIKKIAAEILDW